MVGVAITTTRVSGTTTTKYKYKVEGKHKCSCVNGFGNDTITDYVSPTNVMVERFARIDYHFTIVVVVFAALVHKHTAPVKEKKANS